MSYYRCCRPVRAGVVICHTTGVVVDLSGQLLSYVILQVLL